MHTCTSVKVTFDLTSRYGLAILGTKNGAGYAYLVVQHKARLGVKKITQAAVLSYKEWPLNGDKNNLYLSMYFTVENV
jgi:hypothetical protein